MAPRPLGGRGLGSKAASFEKKRVGTLQCGALDFRQRHVLAMRGEVGRAAHLGIQRVC